MPNNVLDHHYRAIYNHSEIQARQERASLAGMPFRLRHAVAANKSANGMVRATIIAPRTFPFMK